MANSVTIRDKNKPRLTVTNSINQHKQEFIIEGELNAHFKPKLFENKEKVPTGSLVYGVYW